MFERLIESSPRQRRSPRNAVLSLAVHVALVVAAAKATQDAAADAPDEDTPAPFVLGVQPRSATTTTRPATEDTRPSSMSTSALPVAGPPVVPDLTGWLPALPHEGDLTGPVSDAPPGIAPQVGTLPPLQAPQDRRVMVDHPVQPIDGPRPAYPAQLRQAGITGRVRLRFVVTARGEVDSTTIAVVQSTHPAFDTAAVRAILRWRFRPARIGPDAVAQVVEQNVRFDLDRDG